MGVAVVIDGHAGLVRVEEPSLGAGKANLVLPVPASATDVSGAGVVEFGEEASSVLEVVAAVAGQAVALIVRGGALIGNRGADLVGVEEPSLGASEAFLAVPVPGSAADVGGVSIVEIGEDAGTVLEVVSIEAGEASTTVIVRGALIGDRHADLISIENPVLGAGKADLIVPVPGSASGIGGLGVVRGREDAGTILKVITLEAAQAGTSAVGGSALIRNRHADLVGVEDPVL